MNIPSGYFNIKFSDLLTAVISFLGLSGIVVSILANSNSINDNERALRSNIDINMNNWSFDLDKVLVDHPELRKYILDTVNVGPKDSNLFGGLPVKRIEGGMPIPLRGDTLERLKPVADLLIDCFDGILSNKEYFKEGSNKKELQDRTNWIIWVYESFTRSPILAQDFKRTQNWYGREINILYGDWEKCIDSATHKNDSTGLQVAVDDLMIYYGNKCRKK